MKNLARCIHGCYPCHYLRNFSHAQALKFRKNKCLLLFKNWPFMKIKNQQDFYSGLMFLVIGLVFAYGSTRYAMGSSVKPGPGVFPLMLSVALALLGGAVIFKSLTIETEGGSPIGAVAWRPLLVMVAGIALFGFVLPRLGLLATVPILVILVSAAGDQFGWLGVAVASLVLTAFTWLVFVRGLHLPIPVLPVFLAK
jgi:Tripartite tricarboxylate transporter TctB family